MKPQSKRLASELTKKPQSKAQKRGIEITRLKNIFSNLRGAAWASIGVAEPRIKDASREYTDKKSFRDHLRERTILLVNQAFDCADSIEKLMEERRLENENRN